MRTCTCSEVEEIARRLDRGAIEKVAEILAEVRASGGRLFILGVGGSAGNASHAVNDFRKIAGIEAYAPTDNVSEMTARTNDEGWASVFAQWLKTSRLTSRDAVLVLSVGGGNVEKNVSPNLVAALDLAKAVGARIVGIVGRDGGYTAKMADACVLVPTVQPGAHDATCRGVPGHRVAPPRFSPGSQSARDEMGVGTVIGSARAVFLDRDGVLNDARMRDGLPHPPASLAELRIPPGVPALIARLRAAGFLAIGVTNQPDVARGHQTRAVADALNHAVCQSAALDAMLVCYHDDVDECRCRKPAPGLLEAAAARYGI